MTTVNNLQNGDILYGLCTETRDIEIYRFNSDDTLIYYADYDRTVNGLDLDPIIGEKAFINFPDYLDLENPILCNYNYVPFDDSCYWIYTINFDNIKRFINCKDILSEFNECLDMWHQELYKLCR